ncbi:hypothetical protein INR49_025960 [Caranx melampygus]|nr:hypothetical protein INR49_025960 [Caranx melampygus]
MNNGGGRINTPIDLSEREREREDWERRRRTVTQERSRGAGGGRSLPTPQAHPDTKAPKINQCSGEQEKKKKTGSTSEVTTESPHSHEREASIVALSQVACSRETADTVELLLSPKEDSMKMSVCVHENRKSRASTGSMNIYLFHKSSYADSVLMHLNSLRQQRLFTDVLLHAGSRSFPCHRAVLAACSRYFEAMFSGGLRESQASEVDFHDSIHPEVLELLLDYAYSSRVVINEENAESLLEAGTCWSFRTSVMPALNS